MDENLVAFEIDSSAVVSVVSAFIPYLTELDYEKDLKNHFLVLDFPKAGDYVIVPKTTFKRDFERIEDGPMIKLVTVRKK